MVVASDTAISVAVGAAVIAGPLLAIAIFWIGLRSARRHDREHS